MTALLIGYARVSTDAQARVAIAGSLLRQLHAVITTGTAWNPAIAAGTARAAEEAAPAA